MSLISKQLGQTNSLHPHQHIRHPANTFAIPPTQPPLCWAGNKTVTLWPSISVPL